MAPEVFRHEEYTETVDIYSFAMIFYYLLSGRPPWETLSGQKVAIKAAIEADRPIVNRAWDSQISNLMQRCWDENPNARPPFSVIMDELNDYSSEYKFLFFGGAYLYACVLSLISISSQTYRNCPPC